MGQIMNCLCACGCIKPASDAISRLGSLIPLDELLQRKLIEKVKCRDCHDRIHKEVPRCS